ncbi:uncharacterized protein [Montipora foliosa]|uniref:uncharacterized protein n=1 Tax=Montipora foliosa TaxID=591990 RepID=UPI0035F1C742
MMRGNKYFRIEESLLLVLGVKIHVKKKGYKDLDKLLERHGLVVQDEYLFKNGTKLRTHISCRAAILVLFACTSSRQGEDVNIARDLRCHLIDIIVSIASSTSERLEPAHQELTPLLEPEPAVTPATGPFLEPATPVTPVTPVPPPTSEQLLESATPVTPATGTFLEPAAPVTPVTPVPPPTSKPLLEPAMPVTPATGPFLEHHPGDWDGSLTPQDILTLAKQAHNQLKKMSVYNTIITGSAPQHFHLSASDVLDIQDTTSATEIVRALRRKLPGFLDSERKVNAMKAKFVREFEVVWKPERTHSGWQINPQRLRETLRYLYWWLPENEWWKIYGDGRNFGGKDSVALTLNVLNDEAMFNGVGYHSPDDYWPIFIFYGKEAQARFITRVF